MALGIHIRARLLEERLLPQGEPGTLGTCGGVVVVAVPRDGDRQAGSDPGGRAGTLHIKC